RPDLSDHACFEDFVLTYSTAVWRVCLGLLKDRFAAEDAWQETFLSAWRHRERLEPNRGWLIKVATNKCRDALRSRSRHPAQALDESSDESTCLASPGPSPEAVALDAQVAIVLEQALARLPESQRAAFVLSEFHGWTYREIAEECGA